MAENPTYRCPKCDYMVDGEFVTTPFHETKNHAKVAMVLMIKCPGCGKLVWDIATQDQRLNKCWECGLRFDSPDKLR